MRRLQKGAALMVSLVLLVIALLLGLSSMQSSRLEESMTGNHRALNLAHMASEAGASRIFRALRNDGWPESANEATSLISGVEADSSVGAYADFSVAEVCWDTFPDEASCNYSSGDDYMVVTVNGLSERGQVVSRLVSKYRQMPGFADGAAYTCFGPDCTDTVKGNADLTGEDYHVPTKFDCQGSHCISSINPDGENRDDAYYPDAVAPPASECDEYTRYDENDQPLADDDPNYAYVNCNGRIYGGKSGYGDQEQWQGFLGFIEDSGFDVVLREGDELNYNVGGRDDYNPPVSEGSGFWDSISPNFIEIQSGAEVTVKASTNTLGVIVIREGAVFNYKGTSTHEGLIIIEPGGTLTFSSGNPQVYGGVVALESVTGETGEVITGDLSISGNMGIRYSSLAFEMLRQGGKGIRLMSWYVDISE